MFVSLLVLTVSRCIINLFWKHKPRGQRCEIDLVITFRALGSNPFNCDCKLRWLSEWVKRDYIEPGIAKCSYPSQLQEKLILTTPSDHFQCNGTTFHTDWKWKYFEHDQLMLHFPGEDIVDLRAKCDLCLSNPCQNSASCETKPNRDYVCHCPPGYYGKMGKCR